MKRFSVILFMLLLSLNLAQAQHKAGSSLLMLNVGFTTATPEDNNYDLSGNTFTLSYEASNFEGDLAGGISIGYVITSSDSTISSGKPVNRVNTVSYEVLPIVLYGRYMFGSDQLKGYIGAGLGIQFSNARFITNNVQVEAKDSGLMIGGMVGVNYFFNDKIFINGNYNLSWLSNSYYKDGMAQNFTVGLGFQFF
jgi:outer membrane protein W